MFHFVLRILRKTFYVLLIVGVLSHGPSFQALLKILITLHTTLRTVVSLGQEFGVHHLPTAVNFTLSLITTTYAHIIARWKQLLLSIAPILYKVFTWITPEAAALLHESPRHLCDVNKWIVDTGVDMAQKLQDQGNEALVEEWKAAAEGVTNFCDMVQKLGV